MLDVRRYLFKRWMKVAEAMCMLGVISCLYRYLVKGSSLAPTIESVLIVVSSILCLVIGIVQVIYDFPLLLQIKARRKCYLKYMGMGILIGSLIFLVVEKITFGFLEGKELQSLVWQQCVYRYSTLVCISLLGSAIGSLFYRLTPGIAVCLLGSFVMIGAASLSWSLLSPNEILAIICNFYIVIIRGLATIEGNVIYSISLALLTYKLLYKAPIAVYKQDLL